MILLNNYEVKFGKFPNGESNLNYNNLNVGHFNSIILKYESDQDLFNLYIIKKFLDANHVGSVALTILYMPYSRMDRINMFYTFNLKYVSKFINDLDFHSVVVYDTHSDVSLALLDKVSERTSIPILFNQFRDEVKKDFIVMFPDAGAEKRYSKSFAFPTVVGSKERDFSTGEIIKFNVSGVSVKNKVVVIIDDLCSKGGTFVGATQSLKALGASDVYLIVAHCEETIFNGDVFNNVKRVYTTNSILDDGTNRDYKDQLYIHSLYEVKRNVR